MREPGDLCDELGAFVIGSFTLYHLRRLPRIQIGQAQLALGRAVRVLEVSRNHAENCASAAEQRRRLNRAKSRSQGDVSMRSKLPVGVHVLDDDARSRLQRTLTGAARPVDSGKMFEELRIESAL